MVCLRITKLEFTSACQRPKVLQKFPRIRKSSTHCDKCMKMTLTKSKPMLDHWQKIQLTASLLLGPCCELLWRINTPGCGMETGLFVCIPTLLDFLCLTFFLTRFYFESDDAGFSEVERNEIRRTRLSDIILRNTNITAIQCSSFFTSTDLACSNSHTPKAPSIWTDYSQNVQRLICKVAKQGLIQCP